MELSKGTSIALTVSALLVASGCGGTGENVSSKSDLITCEGGNACAGQSQCATADGRSECTGKNACKAEGWVYTQTQEQCSTLQLRNKP